MIYGVISREDVEICLQDHGVGSFIVRFAEPHSQIKPGAMAISNKKHLLHPFLT